MMILVSKGSLIFRKETLSLISATLDLDLSTIKINALIAAPTPRVKSLFLKWTTKTKTEMRVIDRFL